MATFNGYNALGSSSDHILHLLCYAVLFAHIITRVRYATQLIHCVRTLHFVMLSTARQHVAVEVSPLKSVSPTTCAKLYEGLNPGSMTSMKCSPGSEGRYVSIVFHGHRRVPSLAQVLVYGESCMLIRKYYLGTI